MQTFASLTHPATQQPRSALFQCEIRLARTVPDDNACYELSTQENVAMWSHTSLHAIITTSLRQYAIWHCLQWFLHTLSSTWHTRPLTVVSTVQHACGVACLLAKLESICGTRQGLHMLGAYQWQTTHSICPVEHVSRSQSDSQLLHHLVPAPNIP